MIIRRQVEHYLASISRANEPRLYVRLSVCVFLKDIECIVSESMEMNCVAET